MENQEKTKVLIIEDELITAKSIEKNLLDFGFLQVDIATNYEEGYEKAIKLKPGLILMDIKLEQDQAVHDSFHDGIALSERIQVEFDVPVIYLTAHSNPETVSRALHTKPFGYVIKPYSDKDLFDAISRALNRFQSLKNSPDKTAGI